MSELHVLTAHELAEAIRQRDVSATEVLEAYLRQIEVTGGFSPPPGY